LSELRQISTDFDNFWQKDGKQYKYFGTIRFLGNLYIFGGNLMQFWQKQICLVFLRDTV